MVVLSLIGETSFHCRIALTDTGMYYTKIPNVLVVVHGEGEGGAETRESSPLLLTLILTLVYKRVINNGSS